MTAVLALDTVTLSCSAAVVTEAGPLAEITVSVPKTHSRRLMGLVDQVIGLADISPSDLDAISVTRGPGSFTGLRIGISTVKGLAMAWDLPVIGLNALDVLARQAAGLAVPASPSVDAGGCGGDLPSSGMPAGIALRIISMIDARKKEVYHRRYRLMADGPVPETGALAGPPEDAIPESTNGAAASSRTLLFIGSGALAWKDRIREICGDAALFPAPEHHLVRAAVIGRMALGAMTSGKTGESGTMITPAELLPLYIRKSDAELALGPRISKTGSRK